MPQDTMLPSVKDFGRQITSDYQIFIKCDYYKFFRERIEHIRKAEYQSKYKQYYVKNRKQVQYQVVDKVRVHFSISFSNMKV
jgi:hypothetical protein